MNEWMNEWMNVRFKNNEWMNECLMTPQHKNKSVIGCQTNGLKRTLFNKTMYNKQIF